MYAAGCWYRDGFGTEPDPVQAVRWYFTMLHHNAGDGVHDAIELLKAGAMAEVEVREAGRLAGRSAAAVAVVRAVRASGPQTLKSCHVRSQRHRAATATAL
ncbi:SEL1-like repeat protein [Streptomyces atratus]|uniref:SEL1-like repeat protein n=1 Tax=Streptomyces TaxID=1883 RepID=UPI0037A7F6E3